MIVPMKKAKMVFLKDDQEQLMKSLQKYGEIMITPSSDQYEVDDTTAEDVVILRTEKTLKFIKKFQEKQSMFGNYSEIEYQEFSTLDPKRESLLNQIEKFEEDISNLENEIVSLKDEIAHLDPWVNLDIKMSNLISTKHARLHLGYIDLKSVNEFTLELEKFGVDYNLVGKGIEGQAVVFFVFNEDEDELLDKLKHLGFIDYSLPKEDKLVTDLIKEKQQLIKHNEEKIESIQNNLKELSKQANELKLLSDQMVTLRERKSTPVTYTLETVYVEGWVRSDRIDRFIKSITKVTDVYDVEFSDPIEEDSPPTVVKNNKFISPFESITDMFAVPKVTDIDPNPYMAPWYLIILGLMMADVGYGILMFIFSYIFIKKMRPKGFMAKLLKIIQYASFPTVIWGVIFGSYFGVTWNPFIVPLENIIKLLILTLVIGALHIITGLLVKAYINFQRKDYAAIIFDQFSWIFMIVGVGLLFVPNLNMIGQVVLITGVILIFLFAGRKNKNVFARFGGGLYSLYGATSYLSDILSYSRILALSLTTAIVGWVMNLLAGLTIELIPIAGYLLAFFILLGGHLFNIGMGLLSAYVHNSRLQFIEFFSKFYEGGGYEFKPLSIKLNYIDEVNKIH